jgi:gas vesicle protein
MIYENQEYKYPTNNNNTLGILAGLLVGGLAGAITMLLLAPKSGKDTRMQMMEKGIELRDRTTEMVEDTVAQVRLNADKMATSGREKMKELKHQGQELAVEQLDRISAVVDAGKTAVKSS